MNFSSIKEYFYRLQSRCYALLLFPVMLLIAIYAVQRFANLSFTSEDAELVLVLKIALPAFAVLELTSVHLVAHLKLKKMRKLKGMGERLDQYAALTTLKMIAGVSASFIVSAGLVFTTDQLFIVFYVLSLLYILFQRPTPWRLSKQLQLKGDERELIIKGELV